MTKTDKSEWQCWDVNNLEACPGVYVLATGSKIEKIKGTDEHGILYVGESSDLKLRLGLVNRGDVSEFNHSALSYLFDHGAKLNGKQLPRTVLPEQVGRVKEWKVAKKLGRPILLYLQVPTKDRKNVESLLQIEHFLRFGQYPPFNAKCPSIKSIYEEWSTGKNWGQKWQKLKIKSKWESLERAIREHRVP